MITKATHKLGFIGPIGPVSRRSSQPLCFALLVPLEYALEELSFQFNRKGFGYVSRDEFSAALRRDGIQGFTSRSPEAAELKKWQDRQRQRLERTI
ncbi:hypothetical protein [Sphingopyxis sp. P8]|uniref:hypothetical protein n=1 Tax=Sphingopyxis sp. P8 TaxID=2763256 RepID=UPI001D0B15FC|nr:hypothetical protein [Sphingopyxis sp. P8]